MKTGIQNTGSVAQPPDITVDDNMVEQVDTLYTLAVTNPQMAAVSQT